MARMRILHGGISLVAAVIVLLFGVPIVAQRPSGPRTNPQRRPAANANLPSTAQQSQFKYKGVWEPVSYPEDMKWFDVFFVTADEGWVAGGASELHGGMILHTADGGDHWEVQYGDPQSSERAISELRFLDQTHGWAVQGTGSASRLLHTRDGKLWTVAGTIDEHHDDYAFTSEAIGVQLSNDTIKITNNGGRSWTPIFPCAAKVQVAGLWKNMTCEWRRLQFVTPNVAFAIGKPHATSSEERTVMFLARSTDGGASWAMTTQELTDYPEDAFFIDSNTGYVRTGASDTGQIFKTTDGAQTWTGMATSPGNRMLFADPEVGWAIHYQKISFTTDGGGRWNSREYPFPVSPIAFSLPRRDRGYVVGDHGMIYRYRVVPAEYTAKGMIPAPLLSGLDPSLEAQVQQLASQVQQLAKDSGVPPMDFTQNTAGAFGSFGVGMSPGALSNANSGAFSQSTSLGVGTTTSFNASGSMPVGGAFPGSIPGCPSIGLSATGTSFGSGSQPWTSYGAASTTTTGTPPTGGFTQNTSTTPTPNATTAFSASSSGFVQDTTAATTTLNTVSTTVPQFISKYRNLNMMLAGLQMATQMPASVQCLGQSFQGLKNAKDPQSTMAAVTSIQGQVGGLIHVVRLAFQRH